MGDQAVPWAVGRRALVLCPLIDRWVECVGVVGAGEPVWEASGLDDVGEPQGQWWIDVGAPTLPAPRGCARCYEVGTHAEGCMVAANLARGVPAFYAPLAMWSYPAPDLQTASCVEVVAVWPAGRGQVFRVDLRDAPPGAPSNAALIALGPEGFTLAPWGQT